MNLLVDLARAETAPFTPGPEHQALARLAGSWRGLSQLWLDPSAAPEESQGELHAELLLGARWLRLCMRGSALGKPHASEMLLGYHADARAHELAWIDSFHTGTSIMLSTGAATEPGRVDVLGSYAAGAQRWGWRTRLALVSADELALDAFNISPDGNEDRAVAWRFRRI